MSGFPTNPGKLNLLREMKNAPQGEILWRIEQCVRRSKQWVLSRGLVECASRLSGLSAPG